MTKKITAIMLAITMLALVGCSAHMHQVGSGAAGSNSTSAKQWYILFGLVPLNNVDSHSMAGGATNYTIKTEQSFVDIVITFFTSIVTISPRTVTVTK